MGFPFYVNEMKLFAIGENHLYQKAYTRGEKAASKTVVLYVLCDYAANRLQKANPTKKRLNRVGLTVTKKLGGAVIRNRTKRVLREGYRAVDRETPIKRGYLIVIVAREAATKAKSTDIARDLSDCMQKLGMLEGMAFPPKQKHAGKEQKPHKKAHRGEGK